MPKNKYSFDDAKKWADKYKEVLCFDEVARCFGVSAQTIKIYLVEHKEKLNIQFKEEILQERLDNGKKQCCRCKKIKPLGEFNINNAIKDGFDCLCRECSIKKRKKYYYLDVEKSRKASRDWRKNNPEKALESKRKQKKNNLVYKIGCDLRTRMWAAIRNKQKTGSAVRDLGCSVEELKQYLEKQFYPHPKTGAQMTWENWALDGWHIDHIKPLAFFDLTDREQFLKACHYTNLQPLWAEENLKKSSKI